MLHSAMQSSMHQIRHDVFISYRFAVSAVMCSKIISTIQTLHSNAHDLPHAELLYSQLQARGLNVFFDSVCLRLDEPWEPQIIAALSSSRVIVLLISHAAVEGARLFLKWFRFSFVFVSHALPAQTRSAVLTPRPHDYLLLEHLVAVELHARLSRTLVPVYIGGTKTDGSSIYPSSQPPQVVFSPNLCEIVQA